MEKESGRKDSRKVGSGRLDSTLSRFQKSGLTPFWVTLLPLVEQVTLTIAKLRSCPLVRWAGITDLKLGLAEWVTPFLLSTGCLHAPPGCHYRKAQARYPDAPQK